MRIQSFARFCESEAIEGGLSSKKTLEDIAKLHNKKGYYDTQNFIESLEKELEMGIKVELEHTPDEKVAREIAMDHLAENPSYYTKLKKAKL